MGADVVTRRGVFVLLALVVGLGAGGCAPPPAGPVADAVAREVVAGPDVDRRAEPAPAAEFRWPDEGWLWLEVDVYTVLDADVVLDETAVLAAAWSAGSLVVWLHADPPVPGTPAVTHRVETGEGAERAVAGLSGRFEVGASGLESHGLGARGGEVFAATEREVDTTVSERWEIGTGPAPWGADGPFTGGS